MLRLAETILSAIGELFIATGFMLFVMVAIVYLLIERLLTPIFGEEGDF